jgi:hypothetical protein
MLPPELSDDDAIARTHQLAAKRKGRIDGFEVWDGGARLVMDFGRGDVRRSR